MRRRTMLVAATSGAVLHACPPLARQREGPPPAGDEGLDLLLVLAVDVSRSIDEDEALLQREGYRGAITDPAVVAAIRGGATGAIGLAYVEWAGDMYQRLVVPWMRIASQADADAFSGRLAGRPRREGPTLLLDLHTSISGGIDFSRRLMSESPWEASRRVIDVSGDGDNNSGPPAEEARDRAIAEGISVNGLAIVNDRPPFAYSGPVPLEEYYRECVVGGPGAFVVEAKDFADFPQAIRRKLVREITGLAMALAPG